MKTITFVAWLVVVVVVQGQEDRTTETRPDTRPETRPPLTTSLPPFDPESSECGTDTQTCQTGSLCLERRMDSDSVNNRCRPRPGSTEACARDRSFIEGTTDDIDRRVEGDSDGQVNYGRISESRGDGARGRDTAFTINGVVDQIPCIDGYRCSEGTCVQRDLGNTMCSRDLASRCEDDGTYQPIQCRRTDGTINCYCVFPMNGSVIDGTRRRVIDRDNLPDCDARTRSCAITRNNRNEMLRDMESTLQRQGSMCQRCTCYNGNTTCGSPNDLGVNCSRSDPDDNNRPRNCMMDGVTVMHDDSREEGKCNRCGCRNGELRCTDIRSCRDANQETDVDEQRCRDCEDMPNGHVCASDGRTFRTRCHAMMCQGFSQVSLNDGPCSERDECADITCGDGSGCMPLGGRTRMSRMDNSRENKVLCVNRMGLRCAPTETREDGTRKIMDIVGDILETLKDDSERDDDDDNDRTMCASDGYTYPSTCHMLLESRSIRIPRVMHPGKCRERNDADEVCGTDSVTYPNLETMQTVGGNVRMDYMRGCMQPENVEDDTPRKTCEMVRMNDRCPDMTGCTRMVQPTDGCCRKCGSIVMIAIDQELLEESVRGIGEPEDVDAFMGSLLRDGGGDIPSVVPRNSTKRCNISMTRPTTIRGDMTEVLFEAQDKSRDAGYCHEKAMEMAMRLNRGEEAVSVSQEEIFAAATAVFPESISGSPTITASYLMILLLGAMLLVLFL